MTQDGSCFPWPPQPSDRIDHDSSRLLTGTGLLPDGRAASGVVEQRLGHPKVGGGVVSRPEFCLYFHLRCFFGAVGEGSLS